MNNYNKNIVKYVNLYKNQVFIWDIYFLKYNYNSTNNHLVNIINKIFRMLIIQVYIYKLYKVINDSDESSFNFNGKDNY